MRTRYALSPFSRLLCLTLSRPHHQQATSGPSFPAAFGSVFPPSPSGPSTGSSRRSGARPYPTRGASSSAAGGGSGGAGGSGGGRSSRRERAGQMFAAGGTEFERERANIEGRRGAGGGGGGTLGDGQEGEGGKSPEEVALAKVVDRGYAGKRESVPSKLQIKSAGSARPQTKADAGLCVPHSQSTSIRSGRKSAPCVRPKPRPPRTITLLRPAMRREEALPPRTARRPCRLQSPSPEMVAHRRLQPQLHDSPPA